MPAEVGAPIEFSFDFASGYAYFTAREIEALAERYGRIVMWRPFGLGAAFKITGAQGLNRPPRYAREATGIPTTSSELWYAASGKARGATHQYDDASRA